MPKNYPSECRRKVLDLVASGRRVAQIAADLNISEQTIYIWRRQELIDTGQLPGVSATDHAEHVAARRQIAELEAEGAIHRRAAELLKQVVAPKTVRRSPLCCFTVKNRFFCRSRGWLDRDRFGRNAVS